jgi:hypothetical protein
MMQAILIDPFTETIEVVDYSGDWRDISAMLGCDLFTTVYTEMADTIYVDDEGLYVEDQRYFKLKGHPQPLAGKGLVLGSTDDGDSTDCVSSLQDILDIVEFCPEGTHVEPVMTVLPIEDDDDFDVDMLSDNELLEHLGVSQEEEQVMRAMAEKTMLHMLYGGKGYEN